MFVAARCLGIAALALCVGPVLALAEPALRSERAWTDPPARGTGTATGAAAVEPAKPPESVRQATAPAAAPRASRAPRALVRTAKAPRGRSAPSARVATRPVAPRPLVGVVAPRPSKPDSGFRVVTMRPMMHPMKRAVSRVADRALPLPVRYGYVVAPVPVRPLSYDDARIARIRQAEAAGYLVLRSRSVEFPDGRRLRTYRPIEDDADD